MKALRYQGPETIVYDTMPDPAIHADTDIVMKMTACGICGSDLHIYRGHGFSKDLGYCVGHEAIGEVVEVGRAVRKLRSGDRIMLSGAVGCGQCRQCLAGYVTNCELGQTGCFGLSSALQGCQAEAIRVPFADLHATVIPDGITDEQALMLTDNLPTAWFGCRNADITPGKTVAVVGLGPIGLMAVQSAFAMGASQVFAIDPIAERRAAAERLGALSSDSATAYDVVVEATRGRKVDCVVECVGRADSISLALALAKRNGNVSVIGVAQNNIFDFPLVRSFAKGLTFRIGGCSVIDCWPELVPLIQGGKLHPEWHVTSRFSLKDGAAAYEAFNGRKEGVLKVVMTP